jgi:hypothetical protein
MLIRLPLYITLVHLDRMVIPRSRSRSFESITRVTNPSSIWLSAVVEPAPVDEELEVDVEVYKTCSVADRGFMVPDWRKSWSTSVVFP